MAVAYPFLSLRDRAQSLLCGHLCLWEAYPGGGLQGWLLTLAGTTEKKLYDEIITYEEDQKMPYLTTAERIGMQKGIKEGIKEGKRNNAQDAIIEV